MYIFSENEGLLKNYLRHLLVKLGKTAFDYSLLRSLFFSLKCFRSFPFLYTTLQGAFPSSLRILAPSQQDKVLRIVSCQSIQEPMFLFQNTLDSPVSVGRPFTCFKSVSCPCLFGICFLVCKLTIHAWWYTASAAQRSFGNSNLPRTVTPHSSFLTLQASCNLSWSLLYVPG